ncbi:Uncharacterized membrane protein YsdA, DUF1294 family [Alteribacillus persepolensis]|uniref:Uncharacterized membrane protein YsdA, DUF1294 family n=1 Tax=Alteribacillus persepolensis TaxID=568899 RepID=A0A1G8BLJ8_9BACI|nr:DUF1294 domain-containing protein [Alteribacillus persepolensis]SDH33973.1 Uncharacterized membrane protein YsdA, DUF1294 family [Alteribacillus persepolensis]
MDTVLLLYLTVVNILSFVLMCVDKRRARRRKYRISERRLLSIAAIGGSAGAWTAMYTCRHKTQHAAFFIGIPLLLCVHVILFIWLGILG